MGSKSSSITVSMKWVISAFNIFDPALRQEPSDRDKQALSFPAGDAMCFWRDLLVLIWKITRLYSGRCGGCTKLVPC